MQVYHKMYETSVVKCLWYLVFIYRNIFDFVYMD